MTGVATLTAVKCLCLYTGTVAETRKGRHSQATLVPWAKLPLWKSSAHLRWCAEADEAEAFAPIDLSVRVCFGI